MQAYFETPTTNSLEQFIEVTFRFQRNMMGSGEAECKNKNNVQHEETKILYKRKEL
jgi:hypothetical protein